MPANVITIYYIIISYIMASVGSSTRGPLAKPLFMNDIIVIILLILLNGVFSMSEIALLSARKSRLNSDARKGSKGARDAIALAENPDNFLSTIQIGITLIGILTGLFSGAAIADDVGRMLQGIGLEAKTARTVGQVAVVAAVTYLSIVVGELVPKRIGLAAANSVAKFISRPMRVLSVVAMPAVWLLSKSTSLVTRIIGLDNKKNNVTEDEIKSLIQDGTDAGELRKIEQDIMERALVLGDLRISSIMTPKVDVLALRLDMNADDVRKRLSEELHSYYPVFCDKSQNTVCGAVSLKQLVLSLDRNDFSLEKVMGEPRYFPDTMRVYDALDVMKGNRVRFALVCDEFGDLSGVITPGDILDGLVGAMPEQAMPSDIDRNEKDGSWTVNARIQIYDFINFFELEDLYHPASYSTLGGLILEELKYIPRPGDRLDWNNIRFEILSMNGAKIEKVLVTITPHQEA